MKPLAFTNQAAQQLYNQYIDRCRKVVRLLPRAEQTECLMEVNSYIFEYVSSRSQADESASLVAILDRLGPPEVTLKEVVAAKKVDQAVRTFNPKHVALALLLNFRNGIAYVILAVLSLFLLCFPALIVLKLIYPADTGYFRSEHRNDFGFIGIRGAGQTEVLGWWFIPLMLVLGALCYGLIVLLLRLVRRK
ncbi:MAG: hypothetical protein EAZ91_14415 [Cytophagales bacterium]|nr:MAG: hypothetical protein EAZ91_14415 [Cytophagales bacterium]